jgi:hypothetical protein
MVSMLCGVYPPEIVITAAVLTVIPTKYYKN